MICPNCGAETSVEDSRYTSNPNVYKRKRHCTECDMYFKTFEISAQHYTSIREDVNIFFDEVDAFKRGLFKKLTNIGMMKDSKGTTKEKAFDKARDTQED